MPGNGRLNFVSVRRPPAPCHVPTKETRRTSSVPSVSTPALERSSEGGLAIWPSRMRTPLGRPEENVKKSPLTPALVELVVVRRCIAVSVSVPVSVSFESTGATVVVPPGRGPVRMLIATGPFGVNCTPVSKVTPGQSVRCCALAGAREHEDGEEMSKQAAAHQTRFEPTAASRGLLPGFTGCERRGQAPLAPR